MPITKEGGGGILFGKMLKTYASQLPSHTKKKALSPSPLQPEKNFRL